MADEIKYRVMSCVEDEVPMTAMVDGAEVAAKVKCLIVEALSSDSSMGHTFRLRGGNSMNYPVGSFFTATLVPVT